MLTMTIGMIQRTDSFIIMRNLPSKECQDELPRWSNSGVETWPLMLFICGNSLGPARIL